MVKKPTEPQQEEQEQSPEKGEGLLGERHKYRMNEKTPSIAKSARSIGFSKSETLELQRLYELKTKGSKSESKT